MIMKANKQIGFININEESIDKILKDGDVVFERGFLREKTSTTLPTTFDGVGKDLKDYRVYGNTVQNDEPTPDTPIEMVSCGDRTKNLFIVPQTIPNAQRNLATYTKINDNSFSLNYIQNDSTNMSPYVRIDFDITQFKPNTRYTISKKYTVSGDNFSNVGAIRSYINGTNGSVVNSNSFSFTTPSEITSLGVYFYLGYNNTIQGESTITFYDIQVEENSSVTEFEPYGYKIPVNVRSDNLFDKTKVTNGYYIDNNGDLISHNSFAYSDYIQVIENAVYSYSGSSGLASYARKCAWYDNSKNLIKVDSFGKSGQLTSPTNAKYFRTSVRIVASGTQEIDIDTYQLVEGSTVPSKYIPYYNETTNIYLDEPLRGIDEYSDYIDFINGKVVRKIGETIFDGSESWNKVADTSGNYFYFYSTVLDKIVMKDISKNMLCNKFNVYNGQIVYITKVNTDTINVSNRTSSQRLRVLLLNTRINSYTTANFKTWLSENNVTVDYVLETPTEETIALPNIPTIDGNNTLNIETEITPSKVYIKYKSNE